MESDMLLHQIGRMVNKLSPTPEAMFLRAFLRIVAGNLDLLISCELERMILYFDSWSIRRTYGVCIASLAFIGFDLVGAD